MKRKRLFWLAGAVFLFAFLLLSFLQKRSVVDQSPKAATTKKGNLWLKEPTTIGDDPAMTAVFSELFSRGEPEKPLDSFYQHPRAGFVPNIIYALIETLVLEEAKRTTDQQVMKRTIQADWSLTVSWNSPKTVFTFDDRPLKPGFAVFWPEKEVVFLFLSTANESKRFLFEIPADNQYAEELIKIAKESLLTN